MKRENQNGLLDVSQGLGLGIEVNEELLEYRIGLLSLIQAFLLQIWKHHAIITIVQFHLVKI